jgi:Kef-type K+ transport system membrane component KefB/Trk K+ transport system NAD-binding subunit
MLFSEIAQDPNRFLPLLVILVLAFIVPILLSRFRRLPTVVGEILAGVLVGPFVLGWVTDGLIVQFMADIGLAFLMFLAGLEIDFDTLFPKKNGKKTPAKRDSVLGNAFIVYLVTLALAFPGSFLLQQLGLEGDLWLIAFVLSATSLGVLLPILKERHMTNTAFGQVIFVTATLADFITVILLTIHIITFDKGFDPEIFSITLLFLAFLVFYRVGPSVFRSPRVRKFFDELSRATIQIKVRGAIAIMMTFVVLAEFVDAELILGAFLGGMVVSLIKSPEDENLVHKLEAFGFGFFIPVFFILVGVDLDLGSIFEAPENLLFVPAIFAVSIFVKLIPMLTLVRKFNQREILGGGFLLNTHLSLEIAVAVIGLRAGMIDAATSAVIILFAVVTVLIMPIIFGIILPHVHKESVRYMLMVGSGETELKVAQELRAHGEDVRFIDHLADNTAMLQAAGFSVLQGDPVNGGLDEINFSEVQTILTLSQNDEYNYTIAERARSMGAQNIVSYVSDPDNLSKFQELDVQIFMPAVNRITMITMMARNPDALNLFTSTSDDRDILVIPLRNTRLVGTSIRNLKLPADSLVLSIRRNGELLVPRGSTELEYNDRLTMLGNIESVTSVREWFMGEELIYSVSNQ